MFNVVFDQKMWVVYPETNPKYLFITSDEQLAYEVRKGNHTNFFGPGGETIDLAHLFDELVGGQECKIVSMFYRDLDFFHLKDGKLEFNAEGKVISVKPTDCFMMTNGEGDETVLSVVLGNAFFFRAFPEPLR